jgi:glyoxylase-like metal-dependent hydrolase (beta-lactamase superfamily II)
MLQKVITMLHEVAPGIHAWYSKDMVRYRAFAIAGGGQVVLVDPTAMDAEETKALEALGTVTGILLTCDWHERDAASFAERYGVPVWAHPDALPLLQSKSAQAFPVDLPLGIEVLPATGTTPGQVAFLVPRDGGSLIVGDFWMNIPFAKAPWLMRLVMRHLIKLRDGLHLFPPVKASNPSAMVEASRVILDRDFDRLLVSHGDCIDVGAKTRMAERLKQGP